MKSISKTDYIYDANKVELYSYIFWLITLPINILMYIYGMYGEVLLDFGVFATNFLRDTIMYDFGSVLILIGCIVIFIKRILRKEKRYVLEASNTVYLHYALTLVLMLVPGVTYIVAPHFSSLFMFLCNFGLTYMLSYIFFLKIFREEIRSSI